MSKEAMLWGLALVLSAIIWRWSSQGLPGLKSWKRLRDDLPRLKRDSVSEWDDSVTKQALLAVLGDQAGSGRRSEIPYAMDLLESSFEYAIRRLRVLSGLAILVGLFITVFQFRDVIDGLRDFYTHVGAGSEIDYGGIAAAIDPLRKAYQWNAYAIGVAVMFYAWSLVTKLRAQSTLHAAAEALGRIRERGSEHIDAHLSNAIDALLEKQDERTDRLLAEQVNRMGDVVSEMKRLTASVESMVQEAIRGDSQGPEILVGPVREVQANLEDLIAHLDGGFLALTQPFAAGIPAARELTGAAEALRRAVEEMAGSSIVAAVGKLDASCGKLEETTQLLPSTVRKAVSDAGRAVGAEVRRGVAEGVREAAGDIGPRASKLAELIEMLLQEWAREREALPAVVGQGVKTAVAADLRQVDEHIVSLGANVREVCGELRGVGRETRQLASRFESVAAHLSRVWWPWGRSK